jgi:hypothetical protein
MHPRDHLVRTTLRLQLAQLEQADPHVHSLDDLDVAANQVDEAARTYVEFLDKDPE